jgi:hypothetical protein
MRRLAALWLALVLVPACEHMGRGGGGGFGHSNYGGGGGGAAFHPSGAHAPSSSLGASRWQETTASKVGRAVTAATAAAVLQAAGVPAETGDDDGDGTIDSEAAQPVLRAPVGDLCLDCPDAGNCDSCPGPRGVP